MWREAFDAQRAGVYTITLAEAVKVMELTLNRRRSSCSSRDTKI